MRRIYLRFWYFWRLWWHCGYANAREPGESWWAWWQRWHVPAADAWQTAGELVEIGHPRNRAKGGEG